MKAFNPGCLDISDYLNPENAKETLLEDLLDACFQCLNENTDIDFSDLLSVLQLAQTQVQITAIQLQLEADEPENAEDDENSPSDHGEISFL